MVSAAQETSRTERRCRILVIEDDRDIAHLIEMHLKDINCDVVLAHDGLTGLNLSVGEQFDLVVLDLTLPRVEGLEICRRLRAMPTYTPIVMLTARSSEIDRVVGLELGSDDYLTKPFNIRELLARVKAVLRRRDALAAQGVPESDATIRFGDLSIEVSKRRVAVEGKAVDLTAKEFDLLVHFAGNPGRVYTRSQLLDLVWGYAHDGYEHTVNSHINRLRAKIEKDQSRPQYILTMWGVGYRFADALTVEVGSRGA